MISRHRMTSPCGHRSRFRVLPGCVREQRGPPARITRFIRSRFAQPDIRPVRGGTLHGTIAARQAHHGDARWNHGPICIFVDGIPMPGGESHCTDIRTTHPGKALGHAASASSARITLASSTVCCRSLTRAVLLLKNESRKLSRRHQNVRDLHPEYRPVGGRSEALCFQGRNATRRTERARRSVGMVLKSGSRVVSSASRSEVLHAALPPCWAGIRTAACTRRRVRGGFTRNRDRLHASCASPRVDHESGRCPSSVRSSPGNASNAVSVVTRP